MGWFTKVKPETKADVFQPFTRPCFMRKDHSMYGFGHSTTSWESYEEVKWSGKVVTLKDKELYEILEKDKIMWVNKQYLSFPELK